MAQTHSTQQSSRASAPPSRVKRKMVIIKRGMQTRFVMFVTLFVLIAITAIGVDFYFHFGREIQNFNDPALEDLFRADTYVFLVKLALYMVGVTIFAILASHKFAGPIYRFERSARSVGAGDLTHRVQIRTGDEMEEYQDEFNLMVESLQRMVSQDAHTAARVSKHIQELLSDKRVTGELHNRLQQLKGDVDQLHKGFKI